MKQWQRIISVCAGIAGLSLLVPATSVLAADAPQAAVATKAVAKDLVLRGDAKCTACHDESDNPALLQIATTRHGVKADGRTPTCTSCHGESEAHRSAKGKSSPDRTFGKKTSNSAQERSDTCMTCHKGDANRTHWEGGQHATNDVTCSSCHKVHAKSDTVRNKKTQAEVCYTCHKTQRAESLKVSTHPIDAGKVACSDCHNTHGSAGPKMVKKNTVNETCFTCHAEKRGPFLWEHQPVTESCTNCHTAHGSNYGSLLTSRPPVLCTDCHDGPHQSASIAGGPALAGKLAYPALTTGSGNAGRGCMNCHVKVHGSNSPAGGQFLR